MITSRSKIMQKQYLVSVALMTPIFVWHIPPSSVKVKTWFQNRRMKHKKQLRKSSDDGRPVSAANSTSPPPPSTSQSTITSDEDQLHHKHITPSQDASPRDSSTSSNSTSPRLHPHHTSFLHHHHGMLHAAEQNMLQDHASQRSILSAPYSSLLMDRSSSPEGKARMIHEEWDAMGWYPGYQQNKPNYFWID